MERYDVKNEPTILSKPILDLLLAQENPADVISLYVFYYYTAKWQGTASPKAVNKYAMSKLKIGKTKLLRTKKILVDLGLIKNKVVKDADSGQIIANYIYVNILFDKNDIDALSKNNEAATGSKNRPPVFETTNTKNKEYKEEERIKLHCRNKNVPTHIARKRTIPPNNQSAEMDVYMSFADQIFDIVKKKKRIQVNQTKLKQSADHIRKLFQFDLIGTQKEKASQVRKAIAFLDENMYEDTYCPIVESGASLREKFLKVLNAIERKSKPAPMKSGNRRVVTNTNYKF